MEMIGRNQGTDKSDMTSFLDSSKCLIPRVGESISTSSSTGSSAGSKRTAKSEQNSKTQIEEGLIFSCKTCNKKFPTFQSLGSHRTSHKIRPKITPETSKPSTVHTCHICGAEFAQGQSLGGHMRKHRSLLVELRKQEALAQEKKDVTIIKKSSNVENKRVPLKFNLNLTPEEYNNSIKFR